MDRMEWMFVFIFVFVINSIAGAFLYALIGLDKLVVFGPFEFWGTTYDFFDGVIRSLVLTLVMYTLAFIVIGKSFPGDNESG